LAQDIAGKAVSSIHPMPNTNWKTKTQSTTKNFICLFEKFTLIFSIELLAKLFLKGAVPTSDAGIYASK